MDTTYTYEKLFMGKQNVGAIRSDGREFFTIRNEAHFFRKYQGFAINSEVFKLLKEKGVHKIRIKYVKEGGNHETWQVSLPYFEEKSILWHNGAEQQFVLPKEFWYRRDMDGLEIHEYSGTAKFQVEGKGQTKLVQDEY